MIIAPLHRFAAEFPGIRADGMHYGSWLDDIGHFQGVYKPFIESLLHAHHDEENLGYTSCTRYLL